jgi:hypothetical protein
LRLQIRRHHQILLPWDADAELAPALADAEPVASAAGRDAALDAAADLAWVTVGSLEVEASEGESVAAAVNIEVAEAEAAAVVVDAGADAGADAAAVAGAVAGAVVGAVVELEGAADSAGLVAAVDRDAVSAAGQDAALGVAADQGPDVEGAAAPGVVPDAGRVAVAVAVADVAAGAGAAAGVHAPNAGAAVDAAPPPRIRSFTGSGANSNFGPTFDCLPLE